MLRDGSDNEENEFSSLSVSNLNRWVMQIDAKNVYDIRPYVCEMYFRRSWKCVSSRLQIECVRADGYCTAKFTANRYVNVVRCVLSKNSDSLSTSIAQTANGRTSEAAVSHVVPEISVLVIQSWPLRRLLQQVNDAKSNAIQRRRVRYDGGAPKRKQTVVRPGDVSRRVVAREWREMTTPRVHSSRESVEMKILHLMLKFTTVNAIHFVHKICVLIKAIIENNI
jgi:hypothetical protein